MCLHGEPPVVLLQFANQQLAEERRLMEREAEAEAALFAAPAEAGGGETDFSFEPMEPAVKTAARSAKTEATTPPTAKKKATTPTRTAAGAAGKARNTTPVRGAKVMHGLQLQSRWIILTAAVS